MLKDKSKPEGKLAILLPGLGAVSTTLIAGVEMIRRGQAKPIGSLTQMGHVRLGKRTEGRNVKINELLPITTLDDVVFGAWDIINENAAQVVARSKVLNKEDADAVRDFMSTIVPKKG